MQIKDSYISNLICHHYSNDIKKNFVNRRVTNLAEIDQDVLKDFFLKPVSRLKQAFVFNHVVSLEYNVMYSLSLDIYQNGDFKEDSIKIFNHLVSVSNNPSVKDGDVFIAKIEDVEIDNAFYEAIGVFKIETKHNFIETLFDDNGEIQVSVKKGFASNKIDKGCLIIFTDESPTVYVIDASKDSKFWRDDFLGISQKHNSYNSALAAKNLFQEFIVDVMPAQHKSSRFEQVELINKCKHLLSSDENVSMNDIVNQLFEDKDTISQFEDYRKIYEEKNAIKICDTFQSTTSAIKMKPAAHRIKLDDKAEIHLLKTGEFVERGFDKERNQSYYKIYFDNEH